MENVNTALPWILLITTWLANINDLIRGAWFFKSTESIIFFNLLGLLGFIVIILDYREKIKYTACHKPKTK